MPPAISEDGSDQDMDETIQPVGRNKKPVSYTDVEIADSKGADGTSENDENAEEVGDDDEDMEEEEYVVEKITGHMINDDDDLVFHVKWEGYNKKSDMTWEPEENLIENASTILADYFVKIGGRYKIFEETDKALKTKKRGRPSSSTPSTTAKRARKNGHPADDEEPLSARSSQWKPPAGSWEELIDQLDACEDEDTGKLMVYLTWKNGAKTQHETSVIYKRCPQKMLQFYERHVRIIKKDVVESVDGTANDEPREGS